MIRSFVTQVLHNLRNHKLSQDIAYTMGSFIVLALSGIVINIILTVVRDAAALGVFNLAYAVYIVASQFAVWGLHYSVLRFSGYYDNDPVERGRMLLTAAVCAIAMGIIAAGMVGLAAPLFAQLFDSVDTGLAIRNAALGLILFPLNKVLLAYLNGLRCMKAFSIIQGLRYLIVMLLVTMIAVSSQPVEVTTYCFIIAECLTASTAIGYLMSQNLLKHLRLSRDWIARHYIFGTKGLMAGMFAEVNSRVDVLLVGVFMSDSATGIYSFAAMLVDGLYHVLAMVRLNFNPILVGALRDNDWALVQGLRTKSRKFVLPTMFVLTVCLIVVYVVFTGWVMPPEKALLTGLPSLLILLTGLLSISFFVPFDNLMMVSGHPGYQTMQQLATVGVNIIIAVLLLPVLGMEGAALGTAMSYITSTTMLVFFSRRLLGWDLLMNSVKA